MRLRTFFLIALVWFFCCGRVASALADEHGSIAYSPSTGSSGWSYDLPTQAAADNDALAKCRKFANDCVVATWFHDACGALAVGNGNAYGADWGNNRAAAERKAVLQCSKNGQGCAVKRWVCSVGSSVAHAAVGHSVRNVPLRRRVLIKHGCPSNLDKVCTKLGSGKLINCRCVS